MSIIADTLKRLQAQSEDPSSQPKDTPLPRPAFNKGEGSGRHRKDSPFGFLMVVVGMTVTLSGLAIVAFWIGGHLDFGLTTNTQAQMNDQRSLPKAFGLSKDQGFVDPESEIHVAANSETTQLSQSQTTQTHHVQHQTSESFENASTTSPNIQVHKRPTPSPIKREATHPLSVKAVVPTASQDLPAASPTIRQTQEGNKKSMDASLVLSEEPLSTITSPEHPTTQSDNPGIEINNANQIDESENTNLVTMTFKKELIQTEEFFNLSKPVTDSAPKATTLTALKARQEAMKDNGQTTALPPSPANQLRLAQQLIQEGKYDNGMALLSPLFDDPPVKWQPWFWMGTALLGKGETEQADQFLLSGLARNDKIPQLWIQRALVAQQRGDYQLAIHQLRQAESLDAKLSHIHLNMGYAYEQLGNDRLANQYYGNFLKLSEGKPAFFSTRKKLFARLTKQTSSESTTYPSPTSSPQP